VTVITGIAAIYMCRVFAGGRDAIVTGAAAADDLRVINRKHGRPDVRGMAVFTDIAGLQVRRTLAGRFHTVMAACTVSGDIDVVEVGGQPARCRMTIVAGIATRNMCRILSGGCDTVMTGAAGANNLCVINRKDGRPDVRGMAVFADIAGLQVRRTLAGRFDTVMAACTVSGDIDVIEIRGQPARCRVTVVASVAARNVRRVFAGGRDAVMAGTAGTQYLRVIDCCHRRPNIAVVAVLTDIARLNVRGALAGRFHTVMAACTVSGDIDVVETGG